MGLFVQRPEEPSEWGGLPSEPLEPTNPIDRLGEGPALGGWAPDLLSEAPATATWIDIPVGSAVPEGDGGADGD
ncbi:hypothetical protein [Microbacterium oleivorans]|uniref:Uncharacterized protein n=1 Tax=Microbacterium oleivorans TaxID=273677 RepID=A0A177KE56_9MICO|nr:hypothetical protein [Microbacterium oleivorans]OAH51414.1 hypothetical protein AYL44_03915 [Microbacterium oleivorans]